MWEAMFKEAFAAFGVSGLILGLGAMGTPAAFIKFIRIVSEFGTQSGKMAVALEAVGRIVQEHDGFSEKITRALDNSVDASRALAAEVRALADAQQTTHLRQMTELVGLTRDLAERGRQREGSHE